MDERRKSCCDEIVAATTKISTVENDISGLKGLYKPVYGLCILFLIVSAIIIGLRTDTKEVVASIKLHEDGDNAEFFNHESKISNLEGRYEVIESMLKEIRDDQKEILKWQRGHQ